MARLIYRQLADVEARQGQSGAYVIRPRSGGRVLYVGESHTGRLRKTLLRHFQKWRGPTSGPTYDAGAVEVAYLPTAADRAVATQNRLIRRLDPRDNTVGKPAGRQAARRPKADLLDDIIPAAVIPF